MKSINSTLRQYVEEQVLPHYDTFDTAHRRDHVDMVIGASIALAKRYNLDVDMAYAIAAYHDVGLQYGREHHHTESKRILIADSRLREWFGEEQIAIMGDAVEDHRASSKSAPRTIYGRIVAEADRIIDSQTIIRRTIQFTLTHHPHLDREQGYERMVEHLHEKYDYGGYLKLWIEGSENEARLERLRQLIANKAELRKVYDRIYNEERAKE